MTVKANGETATGGRFDRPVVLGAGPVGRALVGALSSRGHHPIVVTRSGTDVPGATSRRADLTDAAQAASAVADATVVFSTAQPAYHRWAEEFPALQASIVEAVASTSAPLIVVENLYGYGLVDQPMVESTPMRPDTKKGRVRAAMWTDLLAAHDSGRLRMAVVRASDFFGPGVEDSAFGHRFFDPLHRGKPAKGIGDPDALHSVTFVPDIAEAMVHLAADEGAWGQAWHVPTAPAVSQREIAELAAASVGSKGSLSIAPRWLLRLAGVFVPPIRETVEMLYEFEHDFVVDSSAFSERFGVDATPLPEALAATMGADLTVAR